MINSILYKMVLITLGSSLFAATSYGINSNSDCGPGRTLADSENAVITLNITLSSIYAGATTSSSSGCEGPFVAQNTTQKYLALNYELISEEMAKGHGVYLEALANMLGCPAQARKPFLVMMHQSYPELIETSKIDDLAKAKALIQKIKSYIASDHHLSKACQLS